MLTIVVPANELWDEKEECFYQIKERKLQLEHSLVSISKWESKWQKAFYGKQEKTYMETLDYIRCMTITQNVDPMTYDVLTDSNVQDINEYINAPMTAVYFQEDHIKGPHSSRETVTSEVIYYWMVMLGIPMECQKWHINRLIALIRVFGMKNGKGKKLSNRDILQRNDALNEERLKRLGSRG